MKKHKTQKIAIKTAPIDEGILPVINWLNKFKNVRTDFCCEGDSDKEQLATLPINIKDFVTSRPNAPSQDTIELEHIRRNVWMNRPYVSFICSNNIELAQILYMVQWNASVEVEWFNQLGGLRYIINFYSKNALQTVIQRIKRN